MAYEKKDFIWTPTEADGFNYTSNLATMASSIETAVGKYVYYAEGTATPQDTANFAPYSSGNVLKVTRNGKFVSIQGIWKCTRAGYINTYTERTFARIPVGFRPKDDTYVVSQGSGTTTWLLRIKPNGDVVASRSNVDSNNNNYWMPLNYTYLAED